MEWEGGGGVKAFYTFASLPSSIDCTSSRHFVNLRQVLALQLTTYAF